MTGVPEEWMNFPMSGELLCALALVIVDICALVLMLMTGRERRVTERVWEKVSARMELADSKRRYPLGAEEILIGRHGAADIQLKDATASRYHALLTVCDGVWRITDLNSAGGTYVNGKRITSVRLHENDRIRIGATTLCLRKRSA